MGSFRSIHSSGARRARRCLLAIVVVAGQLRANAKDAANAAIVLFDGPHGATYVQLTGVTVNGKNEVRLCDHVSKFDKGAYNTLPRTSLAGASSLERGSDGVLTLTVNGNPHCIVPSNLKFDKNAELTPAEAAEQAILQGTSVPSPYAEIPLLKPGVKLVFVAAPDSEFADFLRAQRANTLAGWQEFLTRYPSSPRAPEAGKAVAGLHIKGAEAAFAQYRQSGSTGKPDVAWLHQASEEAQAAGQAVAGYDPARKMSDAVARELDHLLDMDRARLQGYQKGLEEHSARYSQLAAARVHVEQLLTVRSDYTPTLDLRRDIVREEKKIELAIVNAESSKASERYDDAVAELGPYSALAPEVARIEAVLGAAYRHHYDQGQTFAARGQWEQAVAEFRAAAGVRPDSKEAGNALENATAQLAAQRDREEAKLAIAKSDDYASRGEFIEAYESLAALPAKQRELASSQLTALKNNYVRAATQRAQKIQETHIPIRSRGDEDAIREACALLDRVSGLTGDPALSLKSHFLSSKVSEYYVDQASRYLTKPMGSGAGVGWLYLKQAERYGVTNLESVKDQMTRYAPVYQRRARLSLGLVLRDQSSRREGAGFSEQLADAIANGLESSGARVVVVRKPSEVLDSLEPNFMLVGEVLEDRVAKGETIETPQSKYRAGTHETKNPEWLQTTSDYESARQQLLAAQQALADAQSQHKRRDMLAAANDALEAAQKRAEELKHKLEMTDEKRAEAIIEPYHYTKKVVDLTASVELSLRITDRAGNPIGQPLDIHRSNHKSAVILRDVKPEDTEGITNQGVEPDEAQVLTDLEIEARDMLVSTVREKTAELPATILQQARNRAQHGEVDEAAELYVLYLNSTAETAPARDEAVRFLHDRFNLDAPSASTL